MRRLILALGAVSLLACGGDSSGPGTPTAEGTWNLLTVNGSPLPFTAPADPRRPGFQYQIISDQFVAHSGGAWQDNFTYRVTDNGVVTTTTETITGTWAQSGVIVTITTPDGLVDVSISGDQITLTNGVVVLIYARG
ncbi:MAG: hypothetical protein WD802_05895 [Gemmatimonadaceae bacterium]